MHPEKYLILISFLAEISFCRKHFFDIIPTHNLIKKFQTFSTLRKTQNFPTAILKKIKRLDYPNLSPCRYAPTNVQWCKLLRGHRARIPEK